MAVIARSASDANRHCEPTGRANARPMTGSAKQSTARATVTMDCFVASLLAMTVFDPTLLEMAVLARQEPPDRRHEENRKIDRKADVPQDRAKGGTIAEIGKDIGNPHHKKKDSPLNVQ